MAGLDCSKLRPRTQRGRRPPWHILVAGLHPFDV